MSNANANSSKRKGLVLGKLNPIAVKFDKEIIIIPNKNDSFTFDINDGYTEISAYSNEVKEKEGKFVRINKKTGKPYNTRTVSKRIEHGTVEHGER